MNVCMEQEGSREESDCKEMRKFCEMVEMFCIMLMVSVILVDTIMRTHQIIHLKFLLYVNYTLIKT